MELEKDFDERDFMLLIAQIKVIKDFFESQLWLETAAPATGSTKRVIHSSTVLSTGRGWWLCSKSED